MHFNNKEITLVYNASNSRDRQTLAYAMSISPHVNKQEINTVPISATLWRLILDRLQMDPKSLLNKADVEYQKLYRGSEYDEPSIWIEAIKRRPELLRAPIALYNNRVVVCDTPTAIFKLSGRLSESA